MIVRPVTEPVGRHHGHQVTAGLEHNGIDVTPDDVLFLSDVA